MVFASTLRSVFGSNHVGLVKHTHHHTHSAVADPNSVIAAKKCLLSRLFSGCPVKQAKDTAVVQQQQQQQQQQPQSLSSPSASIHDASIVPFHMHAGNTVRASLRPHGVHQWQQCNTPSVLLRPMIRFRLFRCNCPAVFESFRRHAVGCREGQQHAEEEEAGEAYQAGGFAFRLRMHQLWPSIVIQEFKAGQQPDESNQLVLTSSSPVYHQIVQSLASLSSTTFASLPSLLSPSSLLTAVCSSAADLPDDEKNNDHIPLPPLSHTLQTIDECGDCYTGQLCPITSQQHGRGVMQYANGESYAGEWQNGLQHGQGVMCYNGGRYTGQYVQGERCGMGVWEGEIGDKYEGEWKAGLRSGKGKEWLNDELIYDGEWADNARHGYGVAQSAAGGWRYEGEWVNGVMDGYGSIEYSNGEVWEGQWHAGSMHGEGMRISSTGSSQLETCQHGSPILSQPQPSSGRQLSEGMGALDALTDTTTGEGAEGVPSTRLELLSLLSQVASLQNVLVHKLSRVEELLVQPPVGKQPTSLPALMGAVSMAA